MFELAPPAVGGVAWFALNGGSIDVVARVLGAYTVLMVLVQLRFLPVYRKPNFSPGFWAFTFSYAAVVSDAIVWIRAATGPGEKALIVVLLVLITGFVGFIAIRTVQLAQRGQLLPSPPPRAAQPVAEAPAGAPAAG